MNLRSHLMLSVFLLRGISVRRIAFIFGSIEPDIALPTYLKGSFHGRKLHGHDYDNMIVRIQHVLEKLREGRGSGIVQSYRLGKLMHYIADSFTFPHNRSFSGTLREHMLYEDGLEEVLRKSLKEGLIPLQQDEESPDHCYISRKHDEYMKAENTMEADAFYIGSVSSAVACALAGKEIACLTVPSVEIP